MKRITRRLVLDTENSLEFEYDAMGHRIAKHVYGASNRLMKSTYYTLDAQGNTISVYEREVSTLPQSVTFQQTEKYIYGSSRLGVMNVNVNLLGSVPVDYTMTSVKHAIGL